MPRKTMEVDVSPAVLKWARESAGASPQDIARRVGTSAEVVREWEAGKKKPTLRSIRELSTFLKRPLAAVFHLSCSGSERPGHHYS